jgi:hypothetical protein
VLFDMADVAECAICMSEALTSDTLNAAYGFRPPALPATLSGDPLKCQKTLAKAASGLASGWSRALARCEDANARGVNQPPLVCAADPESEIARAQAKAEQRLASCDSFAGIPGCATNGTAAGAAACMEDALDDVVPRYTGVPYP